MKKEVGEMEKTGQREREESKNPLIWHLLSIILYY